jgi:hypothetical protein
MEYNESIGFTPKILKKIIALIMFFIPIKKTLKKIPFVTCRRRRH